LRTRTGFKELQDYLELGVNFGDSTVTTHAIELFILDDKGNVEFTFSRLQWNPIEVLEKAKGMLEASGKSAL
jgi:cytochrome oxidase Cu insertion factor (SCO1/SenC/PrrC family)